MKAHTLVLVSVLSIACGSSHTPSGDGSRADAGSTVVDARGESDAGVTVPGERTYSHIACEERGASLFVEIWPRADAACAPPPDISEDILVLGIDGWDGTPGTFVVGEATPRGTAGAGTLGSEEVTGTITVEPFAVTPEVIAWDLSVGSGRADLRLCGHFEAFPCEGPPTCEPPPGPTLTPFEIADRLARFLWDDTPDPLLGESASSGALADADGIEREARRMIADGRSDAGMARLVAESLRLTGPPDTTVAPDVLADLPGETARLVAAMIRDGGDRRELLQAAWSIRNGNLSRWYGATSPTEEWARVDISSEARRGALTHGSVMVWHDNPSERGALIRSQLLCQELPPHPPGVGVEPEPDPTRTRREQWEANSADPSCAACHRLIDPIGFAFEHFDENGAFRATDSGFPIDPSGELVETDVDGPFAELPELLERLSTSDDVRRCIVTKWFDHALGHPPDECSWDHAYHRFRASGDNLRELIVAIAASPAFRSP